MVHLASRPATNRQPKPTSLPPPKSKREPCSMTPERTRPLPASAKFVRLRRIERRDLRRLIA